jgi:hypothetical protein
MVGLLGRRILFAGRYRSLGAWASVLLLGAGHRIGTQSLTSGRCNLATKVINRRRRDQFSWILEPQLLPTHLGAKHNSSPLVRGFTSPGCLHGLSLSSGPVCFGGALPTLPSPRLTAGRRHFVCCHHKPILCQDGSEPIGERATI